MKIRSMLLQGAAVAGVVGFSFTLGATAANAQSSVPIPDGASVSIPSDATCDMDADAAGVSDDLIKLGAFTPLTGPVAGPGLGAFEGQEYVFDKVNAAGGLNGRKIKFEALDDQYSAAYAQQQVRRLVEREKIFAISGGIGTPNFVAVLPYIDKNQIPSIGMYAPAAGKVGTMKNPHVYMIWPSFVSEFNVVADYVARTDPDASIALLMQSGDIGNDALQGMEAALERHGRKIDKVLRTEATTTDYLPIAQELKGIGADWVFMVIQPTGIGQAIGSTMKIGYNPKIATQSDMTDESFISAFPEEAEGITTPTKVAALTSDDPKVRAFVEDFTAVNGKAPSMWNAVGFAQAMVTIEALQGAPALTRDCLELALQHMQGFETGVLPPVTFSPDSRQGTNAVGIARIEDGVVGQVSPPVPVQ
ncbi:ABC transporter substrate-binding protein [Salipiger aestuarii]|uniref:Branched-chain amino acid transport system substrate-binding protein n=1 Tax=Salipiger aestuarii TaxID=568098 RepID=A0A327XJ93_9RHOB|nr:ABC transporter substrate-binding protein [Salipiger aestuarii]RAK08097.1 branched-chain amino acid transport system substrate-binding protein [Salipiger aestuarii]